MLLTLFVVASLRRHGRRLGLVMESWPVARGLDPILVDTCINVPRYSTMLLLLVRLHLCGVWSSLTNTDTDRFLAPCML